MKNSLIKPISKLKKVLIVLVIASVSLFFFTYEQGTATKAAANPSFCATSSLSSVATVATSTLSSNDTNWAGYIVASDLQNPQATVTNVSASWIVPTVTISSQDTFSAAWIGIGGSFDNTLIQTGTEQDSIQGQSEYSAWVELLPQNAITIDTIDVSPGDQISASIQLVDANTNQWAVYMKDLTKNQEYSGSFIYASGQLSAEWIVERPEITSTRSHATLTGLADVGTVEFLNCQATIGGENGTISSFPMVRSIMYQTVESSTDLGITQLAAVSDLTDNGSSFTVETSPSVIPELSVLMLLPLVTGICLLATITKKRTWFFKT